MNEEIFKAIRAELRAINTEGATFRGRVARIRNARAKALLKYGVALDSYFAYCAARREEKI